MSYEWFISLRYLKAKRKQTFVSLITVISVMGVAIGVTALIVVLAVMTGAQEDIKRKIVGANPHIIISGYGDMGPEATKKAVEMALSTPGVVSASPYIFSQVIITSAEKVAGAVIRGVETGQSLGTADLGQFITKGSLTDLDEQSARESVEPDEFGEVRKVRRAGIVLGKELAEQLRVHMDSPVTVLSPSGKLSPAGMTPISTEFFVAGIFRAGMYEFDNGLALISLKQAQGLFNMADRVSGVELKLTDVYDAPQVSAALREKAGLTFSVRDWQEMNKNLFFALALEKTVIGLILILIIFVAAFNIVSTLIMVVLEKTKDIAILKALGASRGSIMKIFFLEGLTIGATGIFLGLIGGVGMCWLLKRYQFVQLPQDVYNLDKLPVSMEAPDVAMVCLVAMFITVLAAIYPAWSASRVDPAEALRYE
ncbi:MAG: lipoprotein-releasing ABC transporter permease subunit [Nitrospinota bacterium]|nr:lipoprotein-releasing ABC transporter permease subunit [Nitrospinota bacterium]